MDCSNRTLLRTTCIPAHYNDTEALEPDPKQSHNGILVGYPVCSVVLFRQHRFLVRESEFLKYVLRVNQRNISCMSATPFSPIALLSSARASDVIRIGFSPACSKNVGRSSLISGNVASDKLTFIHADIGKLSDPCFKENVPWRGGNDLFESTTGILLSVFLVIFSGVNASQQNVASAHFARLVHRLVEWFCCKQIANNTGIEAQS